MAEYDHINYMKDVATRLKEIAHIDDTNKKFHRVSSLFGLDEFIRTSRPPGIHLLIKDVFSFRKGYNEGRTTERQFYTYFLLKYKGKDYDENETIKRELRDTERKIFSKFKKDYNNDIHEDILFGLEKLDLGSFQAEEMTLIHTGYLGLMVTFSNEPILNIRYNANDWING